MDTEFEVKKLKDLVKKLEKQNQHLRYKTGKLGPSQNTKSTSERLSTPGDLLSSSAGGACDDPYMVKIPYQSETLWLFTLNACALPESGEMLKSWLRHDLDHPHTTSLASARSDIMSRLECVQENQAPLVENETYNRSVAEAGNIDKNSEAYQEEYPVAPAVHHMPVPSHTMTSVHGLIESDSGVELKIKSPSPMNRSSKHLNSRMVQSRPVDEASQYRHRSPSPSRHRSPSRSLAKAANTSSDSGLEKKSFFKQIPRTASPARSISAKEDTPSRSRRGIPTLCQNSPRQSKLPSSGTERRFAVESKHSNAGDYRFSKSYNSVTCSEAQDFQAENDNMEKTSFMSPNRRPLPRPSLASRVQYSNFGSKYSKEHSPRSSVLQRPSPAQSTGTLSEISDVWKDGEFF